MTRNEAIQKLIAWLKAQLNYHEGTNNWTKYAEDPDIIKLLGWKPQNQPWCDFFTDEAFIQCFGLKNAAAMTYQPIGKGSALCRQSAQYFKDNGAWSMTPQLGAVIFFYDSARVINHQGCVIAIGANTVTTSEGNSSDKVSENTYPLNSSKIAGYGIPDWSVVADEVEVVPDLGTEIPVVDEPAQNEILVLDTCAVDTYVLVEGAIGDYVRAAQLLLIGRGFGCGLDGADGEFGPNTLAAVRRYQSAHNLEVDGIIGPKTWGALLGVSA